MTVRYSTEFAKTAGAWDTFKSVATSPGVVIPTAGLVATDAMEEIGRAHV